MVGGIKYWNYGKRDPHIEKEGWFKKNTKEGGADKLGHFYTNYILTHGLATTYENWGYSKYKAISLAAWSSFGLSTLMEVGDSYSPYGMSPEDFAMNMLGSIVGYYWYKYPHLQEKVDFRIEYDPSFKSKDSEDILTNYHQMKHLVAVKAEGFNSLKNNYIVKYLELHAGYYTRGYQNKNIPNKRYSYVGLGINLSKIFRKPLGKYSKTFNYYQVPGTYLKSK